MNSLRTTYFNPRPCARGDILLDNDKAADIISIHAPARGATRIEGNTRELEGFQSTPLREGRPADVPDMTKQAIFQSTPLREGRLHVDYTHTPAASFQSTPLREGRLRTGNGLYMTLRFQSTPLREGRPGTVRRMAKGTEFQSTPLREGRLRAHERGREVIEISIHAPARGATVTSRERYAS